MSINTVVLTGRLTDTPELRKTPSDLAVTTFTIAVDKRTAEGADFFNVTAWRKTAEFVAKYFGKGDSIAVMGKLTTRQFTDKSGQNRKVVEVSAEEISFCGGKKDGSRSDTTPKPSQAKQEDFEEVGTEDDLPF